MHDYESPAPLIRPRTAVPVKQGGLNKLYVACLEVGHQNHLVTELRYTVRNPDTREPMRLNGKPYELNIALCGAFGEWFDGAKGRGQCPICEVVLAERGGMVSPASEGR